MAAEFESQKPSAEQRVAELVLLLDLEPRGPDRFEGRRRKDGIGRVFGGQVIAQALAAAERSVPDDRVPHSLHAYFLRGGSEDCTIDYAVDRQFDGRSFCNRRVVASQQCAPIFNLTASFQLPQEGLHHQHVVMPDVPPPEELPGQEEVLRSVWDQLNERQRFFATRPSPLDTRLIGVNSLLGEIPQEPVKQVWVRTCAALPDAPRIHRAVLAYISDLFLLSTSALPFALNFLRNDVKMASLDHALWFHEPFRADEWLLYSTDSPWAGHARGFNRGYFFTRDGRLVASTAQEGMMRPIHKAAG
ncbi:MAG: acyl-CoA thioesterase [Sphingomonadaceae bacterium]